MSVVTIFVATESQSALAKRWRGHLTFPGRDQQCYALQGARILGPQDVIDELTRLGYNAEWHKKLSAVVVTPPQGNLEEVGEEIKKQLGFHGWPSNWVTTRERASFGA
jgi:hypothetical protein